MTGRDLVASQAFRLLTQADPERVWAALVCPESTPRYLYGLAVTSSWAPGAAVTFTLPGYPAATGQVLCAQRPDRLSYTVEDPSGTTTYVTWTTRRTSGGCVVGLQVDETEGGGTTAEDLEDVWLPVIDGLRRVV